MDAETLTKLQELRKPFEPHQISKLPKPYKSDSPKSNCQVCGTYHGQPALHLDYVGHAALTDRLLDVDPLWTWEPLSFGVDGLPILDKDGGLWIKLTICGITRLGYGDAQSKTGPNATKERIGDALRNAGMRFGIALDLWHKGELHQDRADDNPLTVVSGGAPASDPAYNLSDLTARRVRTLKVFKEHFTADALLKCLPAERVHYYEDKIHVGETFKAMAEPDLDIIEQYMADGTLPAELSEATA